MREVKKIERFFLLALLRISLTGLILILVSDLIFYPQDRLSIYLDVVILLACLLAYFIREANFTASVLIFTGITLGAMFYQSVLVPLNTTTSFSVVLILAFLFSTLLRGPIMWAMHTISFTGIIAVFVYQSALPGLEHVDGVNDLMSIAITYLVLYFIISYCSWVLKQGYDRIHAYLRSVNGLLKEKSRMVEVQNEELLMTQENLSALNTNLERMVNERTEKIKEQNKVLIQYTYTNAHHLRGPVARLMGLVQIQRLEANPDYSFFFEKIAEQAMEIDRVVWKINNDLRLGDDEKPVS